MEMVINLQDVEVVAPFSFNKDIHDKIGTNECNNIGRSGRDIIKEEEKALRYDSYFWTPKRHVLTTAPAPHQARPRPVGRGCVAIVVVVALRRDDRVAAGNRLSRSPAASVVAGVAADGSTTGASEPDGSAACGVAARQRKGGVAMGRVATGGVASNGVAPGGVASGGVAASGIAGAGGVAAVGGVATGDSTTGGIATRGTTTAGSATVAAAGDARKRCAGRQRVANRLLAPSPPPSQEGGQGTAAAQPLPGNTR